MLSLRRTTLLFLATLSVAFAQAPGGDGSLTITLAGQSMTIYGRSPPTAPKAIPVMQGLLKGDVIFTNFEAAVSRANPLMKAAASFLRPRRSTG